MKSIAPILFVLFFIASCKNAIKDDAVTDKETPESKTEEIVEPVHFGVTKNKTVYELNDVFGYWVGWFMPDEEDTEENRNNFIEAGEGLYWARQNKITISIDTIRNDSVIGHSIVAGNFRPFSGSYELKGDTFEFSANEPGDDKYDGVFNFKTAMNSKYLQGKWQAFKKIETPQRKFKLEKKHFEYYSKNEIRNGFIDWIKTKTVKGQIDSDELIDMDAYFTTTEKVTELNPSVDLLTEDQVSKLTKADIYVLRNSIYAKHGYSFKKRQLRVFFDSHDWYMPVHVNIKSDLTDIEKKNIKLLLRYEKYAEEYYDEFGRG